MGPLELRPSAELNVFLHRTQFTAGKDIAWETRDFGFAFGVDFVFRNLKRLGIPERYLDDYTQDVFLKVFNALSRFDFDRPIRPWLFSVLLHLVLDHRKNLSINNEVPSSNPGEGLIAPIHDFESKSLVERCLQELPPDLNAVFLLCDFEGHEPKEVSEALGWPLNTVYSRLRRAREQFKDAVQTHAKETSHERRFK